MGQWESSKFRECGGGKLQIAFGANKSPTTFALEYRCKSLICTSQNSTTIADKSDVSFAFGPSI
jgi:hypothetical protein